ncbi:MAG TPA: ClpX C4-type zinc finger protein, partial [Actinomycetota bacterium]|jgi:ATP-dependent protease Clp ATPase subunit
VKTLVAGPGVFICEACVSRADAVLATGSTASTPTATIHQVGDEARTHRCSFCGKRRHDVAGMASAGIVRICAECLRLCHEIVDERLT